MMNPEIKAKWIADLRTPGRKQVKGYLGFVDEKTGEEGNCCLGRLCRVMGIEPTKSTMDSRVLWFNGRSSYPSVEEVLVPAGLVKDEDITLANMNDREGKTFAEIADYIEKNL